MWYAAKAVLRGEFIIVNTSIRKEEIFRTAKLMSEKTSKKNPGKLQFANIKNEGISL